MRTQCFCFHSFGLLASHWATPTVTSLTSSLLSGISAPVLVSSHLYCHGSNWQGCESQPTRSVASPTVCVLAFVDKRLVIGDNKKCNLGKWVPATPRLYRLWIPVTFIRKCQRFANGIPWFQLSHVAPLSTSKQYERAAPPPPSVKYIANRAFNQCHWMYSSVTLAFLKVLLQGRRRYYSWLKRIDSTFHKPAGYKHLTGIVLILNPLFFLLQALWLF